MTMKTITAVTKHGAIEAPANDRYMVPAMQIRGAYSEGEIKKLLSLIDRTSTVVEVGACFGAISVPLAQHVGQLFCFEPQPAMADLLERNLKAFDNATVLRCAAAGSEGRSYVPDVSVDPDGIYNYGAVSLCNHGLPVQVVTLDDAIEGQVDLIKIDVEGMEGEVIAGARRIIAQYAPILYVENDRKNEVHRQQLIEQIERLGYTCYWHKPMLHQADPMAHPIASFNMLCVKNHIIDMDGLKPVNTHQAAKGEWVGIVRLGGIGDNLIAASVLRPLKRLGYKIDVLTQEPQSCVFENNPFIDKISIKDSERDLPKDQLLWHKLFWSRGKEYARFVNLSHSVEYLKASFPASSPFWWPIEYRRKLHAGSYLEAAHDIVGVPYEFGPLFFPTEDEHALARETKSRMPGKVIGWCITGSRVDKVYPLAPVAVARLIKDLGVSVVLLGAPLPAADWTFAEQIREHVVRQNGSSDGLHIAISPDHNKPSWPIRRLLTFAQHCDLVIGPDTGPMWAVAMEQVPKIMLHSHASVENITKHWVRTVSLSAKLEKVPCFSCHMLHDNIDTCLETQRTCGGTIDTEMTGAACITSIDVETVVEAAKALLGITALRDLKQRRWGSDVTLQGFPTEQDDGTGDHGQRIYHQSLAAE